MQNIHLRVPFYLPGFYEHFFKISEKRRTIYDLGASIIRQSVL